MKRIHLVLLLIFLGTGVYAQNPDRMSGVIRELSGTVELKVPGSSVYIPAKSGDQVHSDTVISTGFKSTAFVSLGSAFITVRPLTRMTLTEISASAGTETINLNLQAGRIRVDVTPPAGTRTAMTVTSTVATASVRGTSFEFDTRNLKVNHGQVSFIGNRGYRMMVSGGSSSLVEDDGRAADPTYVKYAGLKPPAPAGTQYSGGSAGDTAGSGPAGSNGVIFLELDYSAMNDSDKES